jgi:hypothetical protein
MRKKNRKKRAAASVEELMDELPQAGKSSAAIDMKPI